MTLSELEQDVARRLNKNTTLDSTTQARLRAFLNQRHRELLTLPDAQQLRDGVITFASVANQAAYGIADAVARVNRVWQADNERVLSEQSLNWYRHVAPDPTAETGDPEVFVIASGARVVQQPANASTLWVKSDSASDTAITATVTVTGTTGYQAAFTVTLNGTTAVQVTSTTPLLVDNWHLSAAPVGNVTLHEDSGTGTQLGLIPAGQTTAAITSLLLWPTPSSVLTYSVDYTRKVRDLATGDTPLIPEDFHRVLVYGACVDECLHMGALDQAGVFKSEWRAGVADFKYWLHATPSYRPGMAPGGGGSNLGAWYPAGRW